jgi:endonuclease/exonuclease/phosphatase family metal-dependent hydrolase
VYWFQGYPSRWGQQRVAEVPEVIEALTRVYALADADLICLQEVHLGSLAEGIANELRMKTWFHATGGRRPEYGSAVMSRRKAHVRDCTRIGSLPLHERVHLRASLPWAGSRLELAAIHLPSDPSEAGDEARIAEVQRILALTPRPSIICGDMNCRPGSAPYSLVRDAGYVDAAGPGNQEAAQGRGRGVDRIWLDQGLSRRLNRFAVLDAGGFVCTTPEGAAWELSDHPPLLAEIR